MAQRRRGRADSRSFVDRRRPVDEGRPRRVRTPGATQDLGLRLDVFEDGPAARVDEQDLARTEPAAADRLGRGQRHRAGLRGGHDEAVPGHREGERPQPVAVDQRPDPPAVAEDERRRAVPGGSEAGRPAGERRGQRMTDRAQRGRLRDQREEGRREAPAGRRGELERLVEGQRIRAVRRQQRTGLDQAPGRRAGRPGRVGGPPADLLAVGPDRVDLAVVGDRPERLGEPPVGPGVRGVALVEDRVTDDRPGGQVGIQLGQPLAGHQALVDDRAARRRRHRERGQVRPGGPGGGLHPAPGEHQPKLEARIGQAGRPLDERLDEARSAGPGLPPEGGRVGWDGPPRRRRQALFCQCRLDDPTRPGRTGSGPRQEQPDDSGPATETRGERVEQARLERQEDAGAVARCAVGGERPAMTERAQPGQGERQDPVARPSAGVRDEPDAARVVLVATVVERAASTVGHRADSVLRRAHRIRRSP